MAEFKENVVFGLKVSQLSVITLKNSLEYAMHESGRGQVLKTLHVLCVIPGTHVKLHKHLTRP